jgi:hypothetical protein
LDEDSALSDSPGPKNNIRVVHPASEYAMKSRKVPRMFRCAAALRQQGNAPFNSLIVFTRTEAANRGSEHTLRGMDR